MVRASASHPRISLKLREYLQYKTLSICITSKKYEPNQNITKPINKHTQFL